MYGLMMANNIGQVCLADYLAEKLTYWTTYASNAIFKKFNRVGQADDLIHDVWLRLEKQRRGGNIEAFADTTVDADNILGSMIKGYASNARYVAGLGELSKLGDGITICSFEALGDSLADEAESSMVGLDAHFAKKWLDKHSNGRHAALLTIIKELAPEFASASKDDQKKIVETIRNLVNVEDMDQEQRQMLIELVHNM